MAGFAVAVYASQEYLERVDPLRAPAEATWIGWDPDQPYAISLKEGQFMDVPLRWRIRDKLLQIEAARRGLGLAALPCVIADRHPELRRLTGPEVTASVFVMRHMDHRSTPRIRAVVEFFARALAAERTALEGLERPDD